jgi:hypothetical protein
MAMKFPVKLICLAISAFTGASFADVIAPVSAVAILEPKFLSTEYYGSDGSMIAHYEATIPPNSDSILIQVNGTPAGDPTIVSLESPLGELLIGKALPENATFANSRSNHPMIVAQLSKNRVQLSNFGGFHAALVPDYTFDQVLSAGTYKFSIMDLKPFDPKSLTVTVFAKSIQRPIVSLEDSIKGKKIRGLVPLELHLIATTSEQLQKMTSLFNVMEAGLAPRLREAYGNANVEFKIHVNSPVIAVTKDVSELIRKMSLRNAVNVFILSLNSSAAGISLNLPGGAWAPQVDSASALILNINQSLSLDLISDVLPHELGHFFGLFHPCETTSPQIADPLKDSKCVRMGNLMYPAEGRGELTLQQAAVVYKHPLVTIFSTQSKSERE